MMILVKMGIRCHRNARHNRMTSSILKIFFTILFHVSYYIFLKSSVVLVQKKIFDPNLGPAYPPWYVF